MVYFSYKNNNYKHAVLVDASFVIQLYGNQFLYGGMEYYDDPAGQARRIVIPTHFGLELDPIRHLLSPDSDDCCPFVFFNRQAADYITEEQFEEMVERVVEWMPRPLWVY
jgi:hypothetical protein